MAADEEREEGAKGIEDEAPQDEQKMGFLDHLEELRKRLLYCIVGIVVCAIGGYIVSDYVQAFLTRPVEDLVFIAPTEAFVTKLKISLIVGLLLSLPYLFYHFWRFVNPALYSHERKNVILAVFFSTIFFFSGVAFAFFVVLPIGLGFLLGFQTDKLQATLTISNYIAFITKMLLAFGIIFELPVVSYFLTKMRILKPGFLRRNRRVAIVLIFIAAAVLTPPDIFTQLLMAGPLILLFEISIWVSTFAARGQQRGADKEDTDEGSSTTKF
jgi:sec-independent protein translocase protein TatC